MPSTLPDCDDEYIEDLGRPLAERYRALGIDLVPDSNDGREVVALGLVGLAVGSSSSKTSDHCRLIELAVLEDLLQVVVDGGDFHILELRHPLLAEPHVLVGVDRFDTARTSARHEG